MMVLGFFKVDRKCCQPFKVFSRKKSGAGKTTNPTPDRNTHTKGNEWQPFNKEPTTGHWGLQEENDLATILLLE
jgi:hypothetical protein